MAKEGKAFTFLLLACLAAGVATAAASDAPTAVIYNLARLLSVGSPPRAASGHWNSLAATSTLLPAPIQMIVCQEQSVEPAPSCLRSSTKSVQPSPWRWPLPLTGFEGLSPEAMKSTLRGWQAIGFDWFKGKLHGHIYRRPDGSAEILELDQFLQMQVLRGESLGKVRDLSAHCQQRLKPRELSQGVVWSCDDWAALSSGDQIQELWWVAQ